MWLPPAGNPAGGREGISLVFLGVFLEFSAFVETPTGVRLEYVKITKRQTLRGCWEICWSWGTGGGCPRWKACRVGGYALERMNLDEFVMRR